MLGLTISPAWADTTSNGATTNSQTNTSGSNTTISGGYSQESTTTYQSGSSSNTTSTTNATTNNNSNIRDQQNTASAPSMSAMSQDVCVMGMSGGLQYPGIGLSLGAHIRDENCERIKLSKVLNDLGMKVAAVSILCQDPRVFEAMIHSGTPCPYQGKIGAEAKAQWNKYDKLRPDYDMYVDKLKVIENKEKELKKTSEKDKSLTYKLTEQTAIANEIRKENKKLDDYATKLEKKIEKLEKKKSKDKN
tara:strand:+ start:2633 stop:3376 length:744 start_codon:yes stop_codon:yes gene_type:complete